MSNDAIGGPSLYGGLNVQDLLSSNSSVGSASLSTRGQQQQQQQQQQPPSSIAIGSSNMNIFAQTTIPSSLSFTGTSSGSIQFPGSLLSSGIGLAGGSSSGLSGLAGSASSTGHPMGMTIPHPSSSSMQGLGLGAGLGTTSTPSTATITPSTGGMEELLPLVMQLTNPEQREGVLLELSKKRESFQDLAPILWHSVGTVSALLQEIASIYPLLWPPTLTAHASNRVCNALALLQCVASHPDTRSLFLAAHVPLYLYPFLNTQSKSRPFEYLRLTSLGVIGALVKMDDPDVINFLLQTEIIPLCLRIMESGSELSKTVATFIVQKVLLDEMGLQYVCATGERFYAVSAVLNNMIELLTVNPSVRLLKHIVRCYLRLSDNLQAREALREGLPLTLRDDTFGLALRDDVTVKKWLNQLLSVVGSAVEGRSGGMGSGMGMGSGSSSGGIGGMGIGAGAGAGGVGNGLSGAGLGIGVGVGLGLGN